MPQDRPARSFLTDDGGAIAVHFAIICTLILSVTGAAIDYGHWAWRKKAMQASADYAALSAVGTLVETGSTTAAELTARAMLASPGVTTGTYQVNVDAAAKTVSVDVAEVGVQFLSQFINPQKTDITVHATAASAIAPAAANARLCVLAVDPLAKQGFKFHGDGTLIAPSCAMWSGSTNKGSIDISQQVNIQARSMCAVGIATNGSTGNVQPTPQSNCPVQIDPYDGFAIPVPTGCDFTSFTSNAPVVNLVPGTYCKGISITSDTVVAAPGVYHIKGGQVTIKGLSDVRMEGVTLYLSGDGVGLSVTGDSLMRLTAPTTGPTANFALAVDPAATAPKTISFSGSSMIYVDGVVHAPRQKILMGGNSTGSVELSNALMIGGDVEFAGAANWTWTAVNKLPPPDHGGRITRLMD